MVASPNLTWNLPPPAGFQNFHDDLPVTWYEQELPHLRQDGATYFVTFRLNDSLPQSKLRELREFRTEWAWKNPAPRSRTIWQAYTREVMRRVENWLDQGMGSCVLGLPEIAAKLACAMRRDDGQQHELGCFVVMPNHVHAVVRPLTPKTMPLELILRSWKGSSARDINDALDSSGKLWRRESFDRIIRDAEHLYRVIQYIGRNPVKARLAPDRYLLWMRPSWIAQGWDFEQTT
jgi:REP element-mobilizing transposase RayT